VTAVEDRGSVITSGLRALADEFPGWNFALGRVLPGWEAEAVHVSSGTRVKANARGPVMALVMAEGAVRSVRL
jgi:hypothetical protein